MLNLLTINLVSSNSEKQCHRKKKLSTNGQHIANKLLKVERQAGRKEEVPKCIISM